MKKYIGILLIVYFILSISCKSRTNLSDDVIVVNMGAEPSTIDPKLKGIVYNSLGKHKFNYCYIE